MAARALERWQVLRSRHEVVDLLGDLRDRDRVAFASVLGSAVALRLFLFTAPAMILITCLVGVLRLRSLLEEHLTETMSVGEVAAAVTGAKGWGAVWLILSGVVLTLAAGRSLSLVLASSSQLAWRLPGPVRRRITTILAATAVLTAVITASSVLGALRDASGPAITFLTWVAVAAVGGYAWFLVSLTLPRGVRDPGALLPGSILFGVGFAALQAVMHVYVPNQIARTTDTLGALAGTIAVLGNLFAIGRLATSSFVLNAVVHERYGSITEVIFGLPVVRHVPARFPSIARYFGLRPDTDTDIDTDG